MSEAEIDALEGRALDAVIADRIFGYLGVGYYGPTKPHGQHQDYALMSKEEAEAAYLEHWKGDRPGTHRWDPEKDVVDILHWKDGWGPLYIPDWSEDVGESWELVEWMQKTHGFSRATGNGFTLMHTGDSSRWYCEFPLPCWSSADAETAPLAICRAALKAVLL